MSVLVPGSGRSGTGHREARDIRRELAKTLLALAGMVIAGALAADAGQTIRSAESAGAGAGAAAVEEAWELLGSRGQEAWCAAASSGSGQEAAEDMAASLEPAAGAGDWLRVLNRNCLPVWFEGYEGNEQGEK